MAIDLSPEDKKTGQENFKRVVGELAQQDAAQHKQTGAVAGGPVCTNRRQFMKGMLAAGAAVPISAAAYYGYNQMKDKPINVGLIGAGAEGGVLVGEHNPDYMRFVAVADIRPTSQELIFTGVAGTSRQRGFNNLEAYGGKDKNARDKVKVYDDYMEMLKAHPEIDAVVIALPLFLHAPVAIECMKHGKKRGKPVHVLCEKLMARTIADCKKMIRVADATESVLVVGHQRHYNLLYAQALEVIHSGVLGDIRHISCQWHRNNTAPEYETYKKDEVIWDKDTIKAVHKKGSRILDEHDVPTPKLDKQGKPVLHDTWRHEVSEKDRKALSAEKLKKYGPYDSIEQLIRWRLYERTGAGLMAELGSHQLDACSIFLGKVHPIAVSGYGVKNFYDDEREVADHVFCTFEFPGKNYKPDENDYSKLSFKEFFKKVKPDDVKNSQVSYRKKDDVVVVSYSSISTNAFQPYGECIMGTRGTMIVQQEHDIMLSPEGGAGRKTSVGVKGGGMIESAATPSASEAVAIADNIPKSNGYREEMEHFAYCVRMSNEANNAADKKKWRLTPRCHGRVAMADAIIALTSNLAMEIRKRITYQTEWFDADSDRTPEEDVKKGIGVEKFA